MCVHSEISQKIVNKKYKGKEIGHHNKHDIRACGWIVEVHSELLGGPKGDKSDLQFWLKGSAIV